MGRLVHLLDEENCALSRLSRNVDRAQRRSPTNSRSITTHRPCRGSREIPESTQQAIDDNLTLDNDDSALSRLKKEVVDILEAHSKTNQSFQEEVKLTLKQMVVQRAEAARSTTHGLVFEDVVCEFLSREALKLGDKQDAHGPRRRASSRIAKWETAWSVLAGNTCPPPGSSSRPRKKGSSLSRGPAKKSTRPARTAGPRWGCSFFRPAWPQPN